jgi:multiple sugar transport system ATP-binding protein
VARIVIEHLTKVFDGPGARSVRAVDDLSLAVGDKEFLVLVGPSGCGKTTTLRLLAGLEEPDSGSISIDGKGLAGVPPKDRDVAMVFQNYALYPHMTACDNMAFGLKLRKFPRSEIEQRVQEAARMLDLEGCLARRPKELSGGQRQRVALGRALVRRPRLFLFDEPLSNLDLQMRSHMRVEIARLHSRIGTTMIYVTHDQSEAMTLGNRVAVLKAGRLQQVAAPIQLYQHPANLFVARFIGSPPMNLFEGILIREVDALLFQEHGANAPAAQTPLRLRLEDATASQMEGCLGKKVVFGIRPEHILHKIHSTNARAERAVEALVEVVEPTGPETYLHLAGAAHPYIARFPSTDIVKPGEKVTITFDMRAAHFFDPETGLAIS